MVSRDPKQIAAAEAKVRQGARRLEAVEEMRPDHAIQYPPLDRIVDREMAKQQKGEDQ